MGKSRQKVFGNGLGKSSIDFLTTSGFFFEVMPRKKKSTGIYIGDKYEEHEKPCHVSYWSLDN